MLFLSLSLSLPLFLVSPPSLPASRRSQVFYEGQHNDARTNIAIALTAAEKGAAISNYVEVKKIIHENEDGGGRAIGVVCEDKQNPGKEFEVYAKKLVLCAGPFTDGVREMEHGATEPAVKGAAGTHVVLPGYYAPRDMGLLDINTSDGRFLFFLPWLGHTLVGTTDRAGSPVSTPCPPEDEIKWILNEVSKYLSKDVRVRRSDVLSAWQGWRPLASDPHAPPGAPVSRDHIISTNPETGVTFICGGKWTTYREMAEDVVDRVIESGDLDKRHPMERSGPGGNETVPPSPGETRFVFTTYEPLLLASTACACLDFSYIHHYCMVSHHTIPLISSQTILILYRLSRVAGPCVTGKVKLLGGERYENNLPIKLIQKYSVSHETAEHLAHTYGTRAWDLCEMTKPTGRRWPKFGKALVSGYPYIESEIDYAVKEYVRTVRDFVTLRTRLAYLNKEAAIAVVPRVADKMQRSLGWSEEEKEEQIDEALSYLDQFGGPAPISQKDEQELLTQTYTDLKTLFKSLDVDDSGFLEVGEIKLAAAELGFPFESEAAAAVRAFTPPSVLSLCLCLCLCLCHCLSVSGSVRVSTRLCHSPYPSSTLPRTCRKRSEQSRKRMRVGSLVASLLPGGTPRPTTSCSRRCTQSLLSMYTSSRMRAVSCLVKTSFVFFRA